MAVRAALLLVLLAVAPSRAALAAPSTDDRARLQSVTSVRAADIVRSAAAGDPVNFRGVTVEGDVDLRRLGTVRAPLRCRRCRLTGSFVATDVVFERTLELTDATVGGPFDLDGAVFRERVDLDGTTLAGPADLSTARFLQDASLVGTRFDADADFAGSGFEREADFSLAEFATAVRFVGVRFGVDGTFRVGKLTSGANFDGARSGGAMTFDGAVVGGVIDFTNLAARSLSLDRVVYLTEAELSMGHMLVDEVRMDPADVLLVGGSTAQRETLERIEGAAQRRGDLAVANDARYDRLALLGADKAGTARLLDTLAYRGVAGYLVRPSHPLVGFLVLLLVGALARAGWAARAPRARRGGSTLARGRDGFAARGRTAVLRVERASALALRAVATTLRVAFARKPDAGIGDDDSVRSYLSAAVCVTEFLSFKVLIVVFLLGLGSANASVRQVLDAVWR